MWAYKAGAHKKDFTYTATGEPYAVWDEYLFYDKEEAWIAAEIMCEFNDGIPIVERIWKENNNGH